MNETYTTKQYDRQIVSSPQVGMNTKLLFEITTLVTCYISVISTDLKPPKRKFQLRWDF